MKNHFTKFEALNGYLIALISYFLTSFLLSFVLVALNLSENVVATLIITMLSTLSFLTPLLIFKKNTNVINAIKINKKVDFKIVGYCILISIISIFGFLGISDLLNYILTQIGYKVSSADWLVMNNFADFLLVLFTIAFMPAVCEEILFRGICFNGLKEKNNTLAIIMSAFLFMVMHMSLQQSIYQFTLGVVYAIILLKTGNIIYTMIMHFVNNGFVVIIAYISSLLNVGNTSEEVISTYSTFLDYLSPILTMIIAIIFIAILIRSIQKKLDKNKQNNLDENIYLENKNVDFNNQNKTENTLTQNFDNANNNSQNINNISNINDENLSNLKSPFDKNIDFNFIKKLLFVICISLILYIFMIMINFI